MNVIGNEVDESTALRYMQTSGEERVDPEQFCHAMPPVTDEPAPKLIVGSCIRGWVVYGPRTVVEQLILLRQVERAVRIAVPNVDCSWRPACQRASVEFPWSHQGLFH